MTVETTLNPETERWVLALCLLSDTALDDAVAAGLRARDFGLRAHQLVFQELEGWHAEGGGGRPDELEIVTRLERKQSGSRNHLDIVGGPVFFADLTSGVPIVDARRHIRTVQEWSARRRIARRAENLRQAALDPQGSYEDMLAFMDFSEGVLDERRALPIGEVLASRLAEVKEQRATDADLPGLTTDVPDLDRTTTGYRAGELWVMGAIPGAGKTSLLLQALLANARAGVASGLFSLEMTAANLADRLLAMDAGIGLARLRAPRLLLDEHLGSLTGSVTRMQPYPLYVDDEAGIDLATIRARSRLLVRRYDVKLIGVDYLQLVHGKGESRREVVGAVARGLKDLAKELGITVIAASQLSRPQKGITAAPTLHDLKESGEIEAAADCVLLIHRPQLLTYKTGDADNELLIVAKHRNAPTGRIPVVFVDSSAKFAGRSNRTEAAA